MEHLTFNWLDYFVFSTLLGTSLIIGVYFGFFSKQDTTNEYLFGGKNMGYFPVAISLLSSFLSGITFLGSPTEVYLFGSAYLNIAIAAVIVGFITVYVFLPTLFKLQLSCTNEYMELRFSKSVRKLSSIVYLIGLLAVTAVIIYVPALAFSQVTSYSVHTITPLLTIICITYTSMGGVKAVIWTDTFQFIFTLIGVFTVLGVALTSVGGISEVWNIAKEGKRTEIFDMSPSMFRRNTFWAVQSAILTSSISRFSVGQKFVQKFLSVKEEKNARKAIWIMIFGWVTIVIVCTIIGLTMYAKYQGCDPLKANLVSRSDQTLVYFVLDIAGHIPGLPGIFLAGLVSSSLSTMSACLNTLSGMIYDDFIVQWLPLSSNRESKAANIMKVTVLIVGIISIGLVFIMEKLGTIYEMIFTIGSILDAPILTIFILGMLIPWCGKKGALVGGYSCLLFMIWLVVGSQWHVINKSVHFAHLPTTTEKCNFTTNETITKISQSPINPSDEPFFLFRISMMYYTLLGATFGISIAVITSFITNEMDTSTVNPDYIVPFLHRFMSKNNYIEVPLKNIYPQNKIEIDVSSKFNSKT